MTDYSKYLLTHRRTLHKKPELGWCEFWTTAYIVEELEKLGWKLNLGTSQINRDAVMGRSEKLVVQEIERAKKEGVSEETLGRMRGYTGCIAVWDTDLPGPTTALRFDIDCVGVEESSDPCHKPNIEGFRSEHSGCMHSCGHDGHTAVGLTVAKWVEQHSKELKGKILLVFQPAEEGVRGAAAQAASGLLDDVDYLLGSHLSLICKSGEICTCPTNVLATTKLDVKLKGMAAHPTMSPELGRDALTCLCSMVLSLKGMGSHGKGMTSINIGKIEAGEFRNVVAAHGLMQMEVRGATTEINNYQVKKSLQIIKGIAEAYGVSYEVEKAGEASSLSNDRELIDLVSKVASTVPGVEQVIEEKKMGASEDFTMLAQRVQAMGGKSEFFIVGADRKGAHHQSNFDFDENALNVAFLIFKGCLEQLNI